MRSRSILGALRRRAKVADNAHMGTSRETSRGDREGDRLVEELIERRSLLERLSRITSSISHRQPLQEVLDAITVGASELLGDEIVGLRLRDPGDPDYMIVVSHVGLDEETIGRIQRTRASEGAGGRAMLEDRLVIIDDYSDSDVGLEVFRERKLQVAMSAPVREGGAAIGSLTVASYAPGRRFSPSEKDALLALADHASIALTDARNIEAMREAQRTKDMFLAMVSHELKTPLTVIMGTLSMLERRAEDLNVDARKEMLRSAIERGLDLQKMIDQILHGARAELSDSLEEIALKDLVADAASGFENTFRLRVRQIPDVICRVKVRMVTRVLGILLENALSHSDPGTPIALEARRNGSDVSFIVENFGQLPEDKRSMFEPFSSGDDAGGVGLGLYIASDLTRSIGGSLKAEDADGLVRFIMRISEVVLDRGLITEESDTSRDAAPN